MKIRDTRLGSRNALHQGSRDYRSSSPNEVYALTLLLPRLYFAFWNSLPHCNLLTCSRGTHSYRGTLAESDQLLHVSLATTDSALSDV
jgi:hypothetical protein